MGEVQFLRAAGGPIFNLVGVRVASHSELSKGWGVSAYGVHLSFVHRQRHSIGVAGMLFGAILSEWHVGVSSSSHNRIPPSGGHYGVMCIT